MNFYVLLDKFQFPKYEINGEFRYVLRILLVRPNDKHDGQRRITSPRERNCNRLTDPTEVQMSVLYRSQSKKDLNIRGVILTVLVYSTIQRVISLLVYCCDTSFFRAGNSNFATTLCRNLRKTNQN